MEIHLADVCYMDASSDAIFVSATCYNKRCVHASVPGVWNAVVRFAFLWFGIDTASFFCLLYCINSVFSSECLDR